MQDGALNPNYMAGRPGGMTVAQAPKEIGYIDRVAGLSAGLTELEERLKALMARVTGEGGADGNKPAQAPLLGLPSHLAYSEGRLRECLAVVGRLNDIF